ncbi:MAG: histidine phosphatase family protein [Thermoplasmatota archaeon]
MGEIYLLRHGQTVANRDRVIQGPRIDAELSDLGLRQAASLGVALAGVGFGALFSSPLLRARQTAQVVAEAHPAQATLPLQVVPELYEMDYGAFTGRTYDEVAGDLEQVLDAWKMGFVDEPFPGGESAVLAQHRIRPFLARLVSQAQQGDVAVVAHGRINRVLIASLTGAGLTRLEEFPQSNASITQLEVGPGRVVVKRMNDTAHLDVTSEAFS